MYALKLASCKKILGRKTVFSGLSAELEGFVLGIAGANGSGKSTLVKCLVGLLSLDEGFAEIRRAGEVGRDPEIITLTRGTFGVSAPWMNAYPELSVMENMAFLESLSGFSGRLGRLGQPGRLWQPGQIKRTNPQEKTPSSFSSGIAPHITFGLSEEDLTKPVGSLSSGQQQKARLILAGAFDPEVLFLDEPDSHMDETSIEHLHAWIVERQKQSKLTIMASNQPRELALCDGVLTL